MNRYFLRLISLALILFFTSCKMTTEDLSQMRNELSSIQDIDDNLNKIIEFLNENNSDLIVYCEAMETGSFLANKLPKSNQRLQIFNSKLKTIFNKPNISDSSFFKVNPNAHTKAIALKCLIEMNNKNNDLFILDAITSASYPYNYELNNIYLKFLIDQAERLKIANRATIVSKLAILHTFTLNEIYEKQYKTQQAIQYTLSNYATFESLHQSIKSASEITIKESLLKWQVNFIMTNDASKLELISLINNLKLNANKSEGIRIMLLEISPSTYLDFCINQPNIYLLEAFKTIGLVNFLNDINQPELYLKNKKGLMYLNEKALFNPNYCNNILLQFKKSIRKNMELYVLKQSAKNRTEYYNLCSLFFPNEMINYLQSNYFQYESNSKQLQQDFLYINYFLEDKQTSKQNKTKFLELLSHSYNKIANRADYSEQLSYLNNILSSQNNKYLLAGILENTGNIKLVYGYSKYINFAINAYKYEKSQGNNSYDIKFLEFIKNLSISNNHKFMDVVLGNIELFDINDITNIYLDILFVDSDIKPTKIFIFGEFLKQNPILIKKHNSKILEKVMPFAKNEKDNLSLVATKLLFEIYKDDEKKMEYITEQLSNRWTNLLGDE